MMMEDSDMNTTLHLVDFVVASFDETNHTIMRFELFDKLKERMRNGKKRIVKPFEMKFELVHTLGKVSESGDNSDLFHHPFDVKISYNFEIILISDSSNGKIKVFDMYTKQFKKSIRTAVAMPMYLAVEENYDHSNSDAIIFGCNSDSTIFKFDLGKELICSDQEKSSPLIFGLRLL
ncbi:hypothetical protein C9374_008902 [Naegleria lovaniensis]|uniref:Uncharacterized protein n=1 Tax=Naegleria lovaniensis TaxID=51637 RepID=A0AA88KEW0_NAELO|nr:uncharacterized protein C9374_008902 [Naegleria lovaniensis]KAG2377817.1 hypothetical protein C9374_008902 [Naegleria lovaniensis]